MQNKSIRQLSYGYLERKDIHLLSNTLSHFSLYLFQDVYLLFFFLFATHTFNTALDF